MKLIGIIIALIYTLIPTDVLPDMVPVLGWLDDLAVWAFFLWLFFQRIRQAEDLFSEDPGAEGRGRASGRGEEHRSTSGSDGRSPGGQGGDRKDPHAILGVDRGASPEAIKKAYREMAGKYHPDKFAHLGEDFQKTAENRFKEIHEAYRTLMPKK